MLKTVWIAVSSAGRLRHTDLPCEEAKKGNKEKNWKRKRKTFEASIQDAD